VIEIDKKIGFRELVTLKGHFAGGVDGLLLELKAEDCRWLKLGGARGKEI
jgi:hypothetical protein